MRHHASSDEAFQCVSWQSHHSAPTLAREPEAAEHCERPQRVSRKMHCSPAVVPPSPTTNGRRRLPDVAHMTTSDEFSIPHLVHREPHRVMPQPPHLCSDRSRRVVEPPHIRGGDKEARRRLMPVRARPKLRDTSSLYKTIASVVKSPR